MNFNSECWVRRFSFSPARESSAPFRIWSWTSCLFYPSVLTSWFSHHLPFSLQKVFPDHGRLVSMGTPYIKKLCVNISCPQRVSVWVSVQSAHTKKHHDALTHTVYVHALAKTQHSCHRFLLCTDHAVIILEAEAWRRSWGHRNHAPGLSWWHHGAYMCVRAWLNNRKAPSSGSWLSLNQATKEQCKAVGCCMNIVLLLERAARHRIKERSWCL